VEAVYNRLVAQAVHGSIPYDHIKWHLAPEEGWALIHAHQVAGGAEMEWR
jgi:hypothetical protein